MFLFSFCKVKELFFKVFPKQIKGLDIKGVFKVL